ncbi:MAG: DUF309 domain-containing protein [Bacteroidales bacterium]|nr:DUF309 domain-containing protein [Bacteroidales bacterium]
MASGDEYDARYLAGIAQFNAGDYFAAHEVWEELWRDCPERDRGFYQSLIQAAVALYHRQRGNTHGAERLFRSAIAKSAAYPALYYGVRTPTLWADIAVALQTPKLDSRPRIVLEPTSPPPAASSE